MSVIGILRDPAPGGGQLRAAVGGNLRLLLGPSPQPRSGLTGQLSGHAKPEDYWKTWTGRPCNFCGSEASEALFR
jgi:hypothetical protein